MTIHVTWQAASQATITQLSNGTAQWTADMGAASGGAPGAPDPHELLDSALGACTSLTLQLYAKRRNYPLDSIRVEITHEEEGGVYHMKRHITLGGALDDAARADLLRVAEKCPVHKTLSGQFDIKTELAG
ncbi:OsmC family protein [Silvimonas amylolytica]|uniref:Redox protein n=1 Tax=Silvimonas amylolytica TaxID=449663 RepID=A0ABQ2PJT6_9NEIS|nr:OsmC family protein [Silvimonas amylolytica]GGP25578.1 hypothetical protein GCM10010971_13970 [Silvimonas amylolytica]